VLVRPSVPTVRFAPQDGFEYSITMNVARPSDLSLGTTTVRVE
jgi:hypothetical protein